MPGTPERASLGTVRPTVLGVALHVVALLLGFLVGVLGSFVHALTVGGFPAGLFCAYVLTGALLATARLATRSRSGAAAVAGGWVVALLLLSAPRPEGDLVVSGSLLGYTWLVGGLVVATLGVVLPSGPTAPGR